jgi:hypothetical protein
VDKSAGEKFDEIIDFSYQIKKEVFDAITNISFSDESGSSLHHNHDAGPE